MLHPTIDELTQGKYNRYELALATAKCARIITEEYVYQHDNADRSAANGKESGGVDRELRDEKAVKVAIGRLYNGVYEIDEHAGEKEAAAKEETDEAEDASEAESF
jgi:DNA-directed RNA polymerase subunit K/omega